MRRPTTNKPPSLQRKGAAKRSERGMPGVERRTGTVIPAQAGTQKCGDRPPTSPLRSSVRGRERSERGMPGAERG